MKRSWISRLISMHKTNNLPCTLIETSSRLHIKLENEDKHEMIPYCSPSGVYNSLWPQGHPDARCIPTISIKVGLSWRTTNEHAVSIVEKLEQDVRRCIMDCLFVYSYYAYQYQISWSLFVFQFEMIWIELLKFNLYRELHNMWFDFHLWLV